MKGDVITAVPLIVAHPGDSMRRDQTEARLVEAIDLLPTFVEYAGGQPAAHQLEGRSLLPLLQQASYKGAWREFAISEGDYSFRDFVRQPLHRPVNGCRMFMVRSARWKYVHYEGLPSQLFDLHNDPLELEDLGLAAGTATVRAEHTTMLFDWLRNLRIHPTVSDDEATATTAKEAASGTQIGVW